MKLTIRLLAMDSCAHLPASGDNGFEWQTSHGISLERLLQDLQLPPEKMYLSLRNGYSVPASERPQIRLQENDVITIFPLIKGG